MVTTRRATSNWSRQYGTTHNGTPAASAFCVMPWPPWEMTHAARAMIGECGSDCATRAFGGAWNRAGSCAAVVAISATSSSANASSAVATRHASSWKAVDAVTSTIARVSVASHSGISAGGSHRPGPTNRTDAGQSLRGYSYGSAVNKMNRPDSGYWSYQARMSGSPTVVR